MSLLVFVDRSRNAERYPWFEWKVRLFLLAAALGLVGMATGFDWLVAIGIVVLGAAFFLRFLPGGRGVSSESRAESDTAT